MIGTLSSSSTTLCSDLLKPVKADGNFLSFGVGCILCFYFPCTATHARCKAADGGGGGRATAEPGERPEGPREGDALPQAEGDDASHDHQHEVDMLRSCGRVLLLLLLVRDGMRGTTAMCCDRRTF